MNRVNFLRGLWAPYLPLDRSPPGGARRHDRDFQPVWLPDQREQNSGADLPPVSDDG